MITFLWCHYVLYVTWCFKQNEAERMICLYLATCCCCPDSFILGVSAVKSLQFTHTSVVCTHGLFYLWKGRETGCVCGYEEQRGGDLSTFFV